MKRKTHKEFCNEVFEQVGSEYTVKSEYKTTNDYILMKHNICNYEWEVLPNNFLKNKSRCPQCNNRIPYTEVSFQNKLEEIYSGNAKLISEFKGLRNNVLIKFLDCGHECNSKALNFIYKDNNGCNVCNKNEKKTHSQFCKEVCVLVQDEYIVKSEYNGNKDKVIMFHAVCGNEYPVSPNDFLCGKRCPKCQHRSYKKTTDEFKQEVSDLVENEYEVMGEYIDGHNKILIKHNNCQTIYLVAPIKFLEGRRCPVCAESKGEQIIRKYLEKYNIIYEPQKEFEGLLGLGNGNLSYDFYLPSINLLIEFQGQQHEQYIPGFHSSKKDFEKQLEHDARKKEYAKENNMKLLEIWYWNFDNVEDILAKELKIHVYF